MLSEHPYLYCEHDPVNAVDPSGRAAALVGSLVLVPGAGQVIAVGMIAVGATIAVIWLASEWDKIRGRLAPEDQAKLGPPKGQPGTEVPKRYPYLEKQPPIIPPPKPPWWWYLMQLLRLIKSYFDQLPLTPLPIWEYQYASH